MALSQAANIDAGEMEDQRPARPPHRSDSAPEASQTSGPIRSVRTTFRPDAATFATFPIAISALAESEKQSILDGRFRMKHKQLTIGAACLTTVLLPAYATAQSRLKLHVNPDGSSAPSSSIRRSRNRPGISSRRKPGRSCISALSPTHGRWVAASSSSHSCNGRRTSTTAIPPGTTPSCTRIPRTGCTRVAG